MKRSSADNTCESLKSGVYSDKTDAAERENSAPKAVISRLSLYLRELQHFCREGRETVNSRQLGQRLGFTDAQVRKDLSNFGQFGCRGVGYRCSELIDSLRGILGTDDPWPVVMVGAGNLGRALLGYRGFSRQGFRILAAFDSDPNRIGDQIGGIRVKAMDRLPKFVQQHKIRLGVIAVPAEAAQEAANRLVEAGIEGILNFAPVTISLPPSVSLVGVDLAIELEQLAFSVLSRQSCT